jgi:hypothetical protein
MHTRPLDSPFGKTACLRRHTRNREAKQWFPNVMLGGDSGRGMYPKKINALFIHLGRPSES